jgi:general secretion pathway protein D
MAAATLPGMLLRGGVFMQEEFDRRRGIAAAVRRGVPAGRATLGGAAAAGMGLLLCACSMAPMRPDRTDITAQSAASALMRPKAPTADAVPDLVESTPAPRPRDTPHLERYSVVVSDVDIRDLLFAVARDAKVNVDVDPRIQGHVSINAIEQTLPQILNRLARQVDLRYEFDGKTLLVQADVPYLHQYPIDYVNMTRDAKSTTTVATLISAAGGSPLGGSGGNSSNNSTTEVTIDTSNHFWDSLVDSIAAIVGVSAVRGTGAAVLTGAQLAAATTQSGNGADAAKGSGVSSPASGTSINGVASPPPPGAAPSGGTPAATPAPNTSGSGPSTRQLPTTAKKAVIASRETGMLTVIATQREHERVQAVINRMLNSAHRQVLIEATIVEVQLSEEYQQGINWSKMNLNGGGWSFQQQPSGAQALSTGALSGTGPGGIIFPTVPPGASSLPGGATVAGVASAAATPSLGVLRYLDTGAHGNIGVAVSLLQSFGKVKVLSSPKLSVLNNQTAVLKVVDNLVYFTINVNVTPGSATTAPVVTYSSTANTVPVGFVMSVMPQIDDAGGVTINMRPTISRVIDYVNDPNPALANASTVSRVPEIQTREIESVMKVDNGDIAVMGGLMQESLSDKRDQIPGAGSLPIIGNLFRYVADSSTKSELVIFLRPTVVHDASLQGDFAAYKALLPDDDFFVHHPEPVVPREWAQ